jgi:beta-phosphoglucomutase-like phosphatase (HAD superfamily)
MRAADSQALTKNIVTPAERRRLLVDDCAKEFGLTMADLLGPARRMQVICARREAMRRLHADGMNPQAIARMMNRCHTSVLHLLGSTARAMRQASNAQERTAERLLALTECQAFFLQALAVSTRHRTRPPAPRPEFHAADRIARDQCRERGLAETVQRGSPYWRITALGRAAIDRHGGAA